MKSSDKLTVDLNDTTGKISIEEQLVGIMPILDHETFLFIMSVSLGIICQSVVVFGTVSNIINLIIFVKQGFSDTVNISLTALAVSDLCALLTVMWSNLCFTPAFQNSGIPMVTYEVHLITGSWPHLVFSKITGWITAFISLERCICVILPLKVKTIFTRQRHIIAMVTIYVFTIGWGSIAYVSGGVDWVFHPEVNKTLLDLIYLMPISKRELPDSMSYIVNQIFMPITCFLLVVICTCILVIKLNRKASWRRSNTSATGNRSKKEGTLTTRDQRAAKMVVLISSMFITCFIPAVGIFVVAFLVPEFNYDHPYKRMFLVSLSVTFTTESINSSANIFIYLRMSTKYKETFKKMFMIDFLVPQKRNEPT